MLIKRFGKKVVSKLGIKKDSYPKNINLNSYETELLFTAFSPTEYYRIANYGGEQEFLEKFLTLLKPEDIIFDIGASVGLMTVHAANLVKHGKVYAFEPDPDTANRLRHNVELNHFFNVEYVDWAVSDNQNETILFTDGACGAAPTLRKQEGRAIAPQGQIKIKTRSLDQAILSGDLPLPTVLKIDIEGAEGLCLRGASQLLDGKFNSRPRLVFLELHPEFLPSFSTTSDEIHDLMVDCEYSVIWKQRRDAQIHYCYQK
jgi:FkbM family methyltransferase